MSAESPSRGVHRGAQIISPQPIVDRSIIDSVAGIINDIVPQAYAGTPNTDNKESISWARFEYADINDPVLYPDYHEGSSIPPLMLVLGYATGVQIWLIAATGEATEVLSWRQGVVRTLRILPNPKTDEEHIDPFEPKRPMVAVCDSAGPGPQFCNISFISLKTGEQAKSIKFKNPVCDILANRRSIAVTFVEKIAVFDARTLEDILTVTTCYPSPGPNPNPVALGTRWLAYSEKKLLPAKRSSGGCEGEGVQSYTATVLYAAKSLGKGLRGLGETVASSLTGNSVLPVVVNNVGNDTSQPGVVTILDLQATKEEKELNDANIETVIAHFTAHSDAIVAMTFDLSGALLMTADKRGHDFHVFRIQPHPGGPTLAAVHHLYVLHRGDTTAKVQDMVFSSDTRWAAISTVRGTTHVFPVAPYGGPVGVRTHSTPHVVNRLSRFHRSAGLTDDSTRSHSPVSHSELPLSVYPYSNPRLPPYPHPTILHPLAQIRQPSTLNHVNSQVQQRPQQRQRLHSDDGGTLPLKICACFAPPRAWIYAQREPGMRVVKRAIDSLFIMACHGNMIQYDLEPKPAAGVPKEKVCDDTMIELEVEAKGQWPLMRSPNSVEIVPPLPLSSPLLSIASVPKDIQELDLAEDRWLSQVEIVTHAGPHRRLWMGPQFVFKTYNAPSGVAVNVVEAEAIEIGVTGGSRLARSNPVNMPHAASRSLVPVVIDGSGSSYEQSPRFMEAYGDSLDSENTGIGSGENQLREDLAEAMLETSIAPHRAPGRRSVFERVGHPITKVVNPLGTVITVSADEEDINSSQEFDTGQDEEGYRPEAPRSVCAEEGPASLGELEPESQLLRSLTEICAEMRSASEPAIDCVPDDSIRDLKERRTLCVEVATVCQEGTSIDFEREEAFSDVPTSLSLCAEQGEIPNSPMTQAKETIWCKRQGESSTETRERSLSTAQYVVNYDEDSIVLMENRSSCSQRGTVRAKDDRAVPRSGKNASKQSCRFTELEKPRRRGSSKDDDAILIRTTEDRKTRVKRYVLSEHEDSIIVEDTQCRDLKSNSGKGKGGTKNGKIDKSMKSDTCTVKPPTTLDSGCKEPSIDMSQKETKDLLDTSNKKSPLNDIREDTESVSDLKPDLSIIDKCDLLASKDDLKSLEYCAIDASCRSQDPASLYQSDDDIEHIQKSEVTQIFESHSIGLSKEFDELTSTTIVEQEKESKTVTSDDDLEYVHTSECIGSADESHDTAEDETSKPNPTKSRSDSAKSINADEHDKTSAKVEMREKATKKSQDSTADDSNKPKSTKKRKDIVVIESDVSAADVTVIVKPMESWSRGKSVDRETMIQEIDDCVSDTLEQTSFSPTKKIREKSHGSKVSSSITSKTSHSTGIEIIDIDAMQKAEMETSVDVVAAPECKILPARHEAPTVRSKKSRKNRKSTAESGATSAQETTVQTSRITVEELYEAAKEEMPIPVDRKELQSPIEEISWCSIVKKNVTSVDLDRDIEERSDFEEIKKSEAMVEDRSESREEGRSSSCDTGEILSASKDLLEFPTTLTSTSVAKVDESRVTASEIDVASNETPTEKLWSAIVKRKSLRTVTKKVKKQVPTEASNENDERSTLEEKSSEENVEKDGDSAPPFSVEKWLSTLVQAKAEVEIETTDKCILLELPAQRAEALNERKVSAIILEEPSKRKKSEKSTLNLELPKNAQKDDEVEVRDEEDPAIATSELISSEDRTLVRDKEAEKRSDSEQEIVPERSSSSDELNANAVFANTELDCLNGERIDRGNANGRSASLYSNAKKGRGSQSVASYEDLSSSSFSSASRASLDARSSPTPSYGAENMMVFPGDSSGSI
ncbi:hypothetical protein KM043_011785 [Ampulex compressa]|nr:hypothetical protein KM043_011785 [Ampulex compressa]